MPQENLTLKIFKLVLIASLLSSVLVGGASLWRLKRAIASGYTDFIIFYTGAEILKAGMGKRLYDYATQKAFQDKFEVPIREGPLLFNHPPFELLVFLPLTYLPYPAAFLIWSVVNLALLVATFWLIMPFIDKQHRIILGFMLFGFYPVFVTMAQGQDSILLTFLLTATFNRLKYQRESIAGAFLALALFKPQLVLPTAFVLVFKRRWAAVVWFLTVSVFLGLLSLGMVGWDAIIEFVAVVAKMNQPRYYIYPAVMPNVRGFFETLLAGHSSTLSFIMIILISLALLLLLLYFWRGNYQPDEALFNLKFSLTMVTTLLTSYYLYAHDLTLLTLPAILISDCVLTNQAQAHISRSIFLWLLLLLWFPLTYIVLLENRQLSWLFWVILILAGALALEISHINRLKQQTNPT